MISLYCSVRCSDQRFGMLQKDVVGHEGTSLRECAMDLGDACMA